MANEMILTINKCPRCGCNEFHKTTYVKQRFVIHYNFLGDTNKLKLGGSHYGDEMDEYKQEDKLRCMNCNYSVERYIKYI